MTVLTLASTVSNTGPSATSGSGTGSAGSASALPIDLTSVAYAQITSASLNATTDVLTIDAGQSSTTIQLSGDQAGESIGLSSDGGTGTDIVNLGAAPNISDSISTASAAAVQTVIRADSNLQFVNTYAQGVSSAYEDAIVAAENFYQAHIANTDTLNFTYNSVTSSGSFVATNNFYYDSVDFQTLLSALQRHAVSPEQQAAVAAITRQSAVFADDLFRVPEDLAVMLGLPGASSDTSVTVDLNMRLDFFYDQADPAAGEHDAVAAIEHEISEGGLGRIGGSVSSSGTASNAIMDLFRYSAPGQVDDTFGQDGKAAYFSINGAALLTEFHDPVNTSGVSDGADSADWDATSAWNVQQPTSVGPNQFDAYGANPAGQVGVVTPTDLSVLNVLGWTLSTSYLTSPTVLSGATINVDPSQIASGMTVESGGMLNLDAGAAASAITVQNGGTLQVFSLAEAQNTFVDGLGALDVDLGGSASGVTISSGGSMTVSSGGSASGVTIVPGGNVYVSSGGSLIDAQDDGSLTVLAGGFDNALVVGAGGSATFSSGSSDSFATVDGGVLTVDSGALASFADLEEGTLVLSGGWFFSADGLQAGMRIDFAGLTSAAFDWSDDTVPALVVSSGGAAVGSVGFVGSAAWTIFTQPDGGGGTRVSFEDLGQLTGSVGVYSAGAAVDDQLYAVGGALLGSQFTSAAGDQAITQYLDSLGAQYAATIQTVSGNETERQDFNSAWSQTDAAITYALGGGATLQQYFDGAWDLLGATYATSSGNTAAVQSFDGGWSQLSATRTTSSGGVAIVQDFNSAWDQTSAQRIVSVGEQTTTQSFDSAWRQISASIVTSAAGSVETQDFDAAWRQVSASIVSQPNTSQTITQTFDSAWSQLSADIVTVSGGVTTTQDFNGAWALTGGLVASALNAQTELVQHYDSAWTHLTGQDQLIVEVTSGLQVLEGSAVTGVATTFVIRPGDVNGDAFDGFVTAGMNPSSHDVLAFEGYGPGAALTRIDSSHWQISASGKASEVFTLAASLNPAAGDVTFGQGV
jgi:autotransporter passenger strand-loop-strand repeat protein